jgi:prevent-host-death family protein
MYSTTGIDAIATITELRSNTSELLDQVRENRTRVLIQKNNEAFAVLIDWDTYQKLVEGEPDVAGERNDRPVKRKGRKKSSQTGGTS